MPALSLHGRLYIRQSVARVLMRVPPILVVVSILASDKGSVTLSQVKDVVVAVHPAGALRQLYPVVGLRHGFGVRDLRARVIAPILLLDPVQTHIGIAAVVGHRIAVVVIDQHVVAIDIHIDINRLILPCIQVKPIIVRLD